MLSYLIFIDTNVVYDDFFFKSNNIKKLLRFTKHETVKLCFTELNYNEIIKKYRDNVRPTLKEIRTVRNRVSKQLEELGIGSLFDIEKLRSDTYVESYKQFLDEVIEEYRIQVIKYPTGESTIAQIAKKYFAGTKPFSENKLSFQDAIMWQTIVEHCDKENPTNVVFITNNTRDFANRAKDDIHDELKNEINNLIFYNSVGAFLEYEEENLHEYFIDNYEHDVDLIQNELNSYFDGNMSLDYSLNDFLMNSNFDGEFISGWGNDGLIEEMEFDIIEVTLDIEENQLLISFQVILNVSFHIETIDPTYERGDSGDGMLSENSSAQIFVNGDVTYSIDQEKIIDYVEEEIDFL